MKLLWMHKKLGHRMSVYKQFYQNVTGLDRIKYIQIQYKQFLLLMCACVHPPPWSYLSIALEPLKQYHITVT